MVVRVDDVVIFKNVDTVPVFQTAADAVANSGSTGVRYTNETVYVRQIWGRSNGNAIDLGKSSDTLYIHAIAYSRTNSGIGEGWMNYRALNLDAMGTATPPPPTTGGGGTGGSTGYSFKNIGFNHGTQTTLGGDGLLINPTALPPAHHIRFNIKYRNSNNTLRTVAKYLPITGRITADFTESEVGTILSDMGSASSITATAGASLYSDIGVPIDTKTWTITIYKGQTVGMPKSSNPSNPISVTVSNGGAGGIVYPGHSKLNITFAYVDPGYGTLTYLRLIDEQGYGWILTPFNDSSKSSITATGGTDSVPQRWFTSTQTLKLVAKNSVGQEAIIKSNVISLKAETYSGMGISSFIISNRLDNSVSLTGDGVFDTKISTRPTFKIDLLNPSGVVVQSTGWLATTANGTGKWKLSHTFSSLSAVSSYLARLTIQDNNNRQSVQTVNIGGASIPLSLGRNGAGVGVMVDDNLGYDLQVGVNGIHSLGPIYVNGKKIGDIEGKLEIGAEGIHSQGDIKSDKTISGNSLVGTTLKVGSATIQKTGSTATTLQMTNTDITYNGQSLLNSGNTFDNPISNVYAHSSNTYGRYSVENQILVKYGKATVSGSEYTVNFNSNGGSFAVPPIVQVSAVSGRWEFATPSLTTVTVSGFTASSVNVANGQGVSTSHEIHYIAIGIRL